MHIKKLTRSELHKILAHDKRENLTYSNENIDILQSNKNVIYQNNKLDDVIKGVHIHGKSGKSADKINYACSVVVHYPSECPISQNEFFGLMNYALSNKFGKNNVLLSVVHNDETRPHLHFVFCPIVEDKKHGRKLCCKNVVNREMLQNFHEDIENVMTALCGKNIVLRNDEEIRGIPYVEDIEVYKKLKDLESKQNSLLEYTQKLEDYANKLEEYCDSKIVELQNLKDEIKQHRKELSNIFNESSLDNVIKGYKDFNR